MGGSQIKLNEKESARGKRIGGGRTEGKGERQWAEKGV